VKRTHSKARRPDVYRVQRGKPWWRRKWQAEWDGCLWAARGYTRRGVWVSVWVRTRWGWRAEGCYHRLRVAVRRNLTRDDFYVRRYDRLGRTKRAGIRVS
jgi:hypothetical protein